MHKTDNINIEDIQSLPTPEEILHQHPITDQASETVASSRQVLENILSGKDSRVMVITGPCSIHNKESAFEYAARIKELSKKVEDSIYLVMRVYFEKPRTTVGWKGLIYDPDLNNTSNITKGLTEAREILLKITDSGVPTATEVLDPVIPQYISDLISWTAIGARTTESQTHRQMASGLSMPIGFKNATDGSIMVAVDAIKTAAHKHAFLGVRQNGQIAVFRTKGNQFGHMVLRGGAGQPNFGSEHIAFTEELMKKNSVNPAIVVDCSHANSNKNPEKQASVMLDIAEQIKNGCKSIKGVMLESHLKTGSQKIIPGQSIAPDLSITDACLGFSETEELILKARQILKS